MRIRREIEFPQKAQVPKEVGGKIRYRGSIAPVVEQGTAGPAVKSFRRQDAGEKFQGL
jgi:hypothetical protein